MWFGAWIDDAQGFEVPEIFTVGCTESEQIRRVFRRRERLRTRAFDGRYGWDMEGVKHCGLAGM